MMSASVVVIGAGPAGCVFAARMAALGHDVVLIERAAFPRDRLGESLSPGVLPLLDTIGARHDIERAGFTGVDKLATNWDGRTEERQPAPGGLLVDRGRFDTLLLARAQALGVRVLQPANVAHLSHVGHLFRGAIHEDGGWRLGVDAAGGPIELHAAFVADATGRGGILPRKRVPTGARTLALHAYWRSRKMPACPRIEVGEHAWYWGVPLPDGRYNTLMFVASKGLKNPRHEYEGHLSRSGLMAGVVEPCLDGPVRAIDATPFLDETAVAPASIKIGDAAVAIDPLSSSGVQKAIQSALAAAVVANTLLRRPASADIAMQFYRDHLREASDRHRRWAAEHYATVAARLTTPFWQERASFVVSAFRRTDEVRLKPDTTTVVELSPLAEIVDIPCLDGAFVARKRAIRHPNLDRPVAFVGEWEVAPLVAGVAAGMTPMQLARSWSNRMPMASALAVTGWLIDRGILQPRLPDTPLVVSLSNHEPGARPSTGSRRAGRD